MTKRSSVKKLAKDTPCHAGELAHLGSPELGYVGDVLAEEQRGLVYGILLIDSFLLSCFGLFFLPGSSSLPSSRTFRLGFLDCIFDGENVGSCQACMQTWLFLEKEHRERSS